jgi:hypothetical protein
METNEFSFASENGSVVIASQLVAKAGAAHADPAAVRQKQESELRRKCGRA